MMREMGRSALRAFYILPVVSVMHVIESLCPWDCNIAPRCLPDFTSCG